MIDVYGLKNCDTCKKATAWLDDHDIAYTFHDVRAEPLTSQQVGTWVKELGSTTLVNRRGTTWRQLPAAAQNNAGTAEGARDLILAHPALMKRPVFDLGHERLVGFSPEIRKALSEN
jgi:arsenate reductase (glutaredoxin)